MPRLAREPAGFVASDIGQLAYQSATQTYWRLTTTAPTWTSDTTGGIIVKGTMTCTVTKFPPRPSYVYGAVFTIGYQYLGRGPIWNAATQSLGIPAIDGRHSHVRHMKTHSSSRSGLTLVELSVTTGVVGVLGLIIYPLLNMGTVLGAKNTAMNTAHQQARVAMLEMVQDLHAAISLPAD